MIGFGLDVIRIYIVVRKSEGRGNVMTDDSVGRVLPQTMELLMIPPPLGSNYVHRILSIYRLSYPDTGLSQ